MRVRESYRIILFAIAAVMILPQLVSGLSITTIIVSPEGTLIPGTPVTVDFTIKFQSPDDSSVGLYDLNLLTDLDNPNWAMKRSWKLSISDHEMGSYSNGKIMVLYSWDIMDMIETLPNGENHVHLTGFAPAVPTTRNITLVKIWKTDDSNCNCLNSFRIERRALVINSSEIPLLIENRNSSLAQFRKSLDEKAAMGVNITEAEAYYLDAMQKIDRAEQLPALQYTDAMDNLTAARADITEGEQLLDKAWAEKEIMEAQVPVQNTDNILRMIITNRTGPPALREIIKIREEAVSYITIANDKLAAGNYPAARESAGIAFTRGNESYTSALEYAQQEARPTPPALLSPLCCIFTLGSAGIVICRKKRRG